MNWRTQLNQLAVDFWCGIGDLDELTRWADTANAATGEVHPDVWDLYTIQTAEVGKQVILKIAKDCNQFEPAELTAEFFVIQSFKKAIQLLLSCRLTVVRFCDLVNLLDSYFVTIVRTTTSPYPNWLGNLWNCCDWYEEGRASTPQKQVIFNEAIRVLELINSIPNPQID